MLMSGDCGDFLIAAVIVLCLTALAYSCFRLGEAMRGDK